MCKIAIIPGIKKSKSNDAFKLALAMTSGLCSGAEKHGFGYAALSDKGLFGERWLNVDDAWKSAHVLREREAGLVKSHFGFLESKNEYNNFGEYTEKASALMLHARYSTNSISMENTHPFVDEKSNTALIHNGIVSDRLLDLRTSTCDSEGILNLYTDEKIQNYLSGINEVTQSLDGYYACGVISKTKKGKWVLDIFKANGANLSAVYVPHLETLVYCTNPEIVIKACRSLKWKVGATIDVNDQIILRYDAKTGKPLDALEFDTFDNLITSPENFKFNSGLVGDDLPTDDYVDTYLKEADYLDRDFYSVKKHSKKKAG